MWEAHECKHTNAHYGKSSLCLSIPAISLKKPEDSSASNPGKLDFLPTSTNGAGFARLNYLMGLSSLS